MALVGYLIVFSIVTKCGQTIEFLLWGTIVPLNFLVGYHCSIVASTPQYPTTYGVRVHTHPHRVSLMLNTQNVMVMEDVIFFSNFNIRKLQISTAEFVHSFGYKRAILDHPIRRKMCTIFRCL